MSDLLGGTASVTFFRLEKNNIQSMTPPECRRIKNRDLNEGLARVSDFMGGGFRSKSVVAGFLAAENLRYLAEAEGIHVCQGNIWSQYAIDNQDGDGSLCYPYYPSTEHFCKPAQRGSDFIDCVNLDGWTVDFLAARRQGLADGFNSRMGVGPIETIGAFGPDRGLDQMMATTASHFDDGFARNGFAWIMCCWEKSTRSRRARRINPCSSARWKKYTKT